MPTATEPQITAVRNGDRYMKCASCRSTADWQLLYPDGTLGATTCTQHQACNERKMRAAR